MVLFHSEKTSITESAQASKEVNQAMLKYFKEPQLLVFRAATLLAFLGPHLRGITFFDIQLPKHSENKCLITM